MEAPHYLTLQKLQKYLIQEKKIINLRQSQITEINLETSNVCVG